MPGSYPDPRSHATEAIQILKEAYYEIPEAHAKNLILKAIDAISQLKEELKGLSQQRVSYLDAYEFDDSNSAV
jgi:transposase